VGGDGRQVVGGGWYVVGGVWWVLQGRMHILPWKRRTGNLHLNGQTVTPLRHPTPEPFCNRESARRPTLKEKISTTKKHAKEISNSKKEKLI